jgi:serine protease Do
MNVRANPGDMGGAVLNSRGEVVGMVCATLADPRCSSQAAAGEGEPGLAGTSGIWGDTGISFAVVLSSVMPIVRRMQEGGGLERGFLGVEIRDLAALPGDEKAPAAAQAREPGVQVVRILPGSPADQAGLRGGDVILQVNGQEVTSSRTLRNLVFDSRPGTRLELGVRREGLSIPLVATVGRLRPARPAAREAGAPAAVSTPVSLSEAAGQNEADRTQDLRARVAELEQELSRLARELGRTPPLDIPAEEGR